MRRKKILLLLVLFCQLSMFANLTDYTNVYVVLGKKTQKPHLYEPCVQYNTYSNELSIDFGTAPIASYTVTISAPLFETDYVMFSPQASIPLAVDGESDYEIVIETFDGDVFEGTLAACEYNSAQTI